VVVSVSAFIVECSSTRRAREVRGAVDWAEVRAMHADGVKKREIARRLGISRNTVDKLGG
jgi:DNA invertase Pin-like site-specific DNA recombinase